MKCRNCDNPATVAVRSGLEWHPTCAECAAWWGDQRKGSLAEVEPDYEYENDEYSARMERDAEEDYLGPSSKGV